MRCWAQWALPVSSVQGKPDRKIPGACWLDSEWAPDSVKETASEIKIKVKSKVECSWEKHPTPCGHHISFTHEDIPVCAHKQNSHHLVMSSFYRYVVLSILLLSTVQWSQDWLVENGELISLSTWWNICVFQELIETKLPSGRLSWLKLWSDEFIVSSSPCQYWKWILLISSTYFEVDTANIL